MRKILDKIILKRINQFLEENDCIRKEQYGFTKNISTELQLARIKDKITTNFTKGKVTSIITIGLEKAKDTIWIIGLINKMEKMKIPRLYSLWGTKIKTPR